MPSIDHNNYTPSVFIGTMLWLTGTEIDSINLTTVLNDWTLIQSVKE